MRLLPSLILVIVAARDCISSSIPSTPSFIFPIVSVAEMNWV